MTILYRLAKAQDTVNISRVFTRSIDDLDREHGFYDSPTKPVPPDPSYQFLIETEPGAFWVAEDKGKIVGFSSSFLRGSFWFLAHLFIHPLYQGKGIGRALIERSLGRWKSTKIANRALITLAFNPVSISLYTRYGMYPREPLYFASAPKEVVRKSVKRAGPHALKYEKASTLKHVASTLEQIDKSVLGFSLGAHHEFFFNVQRSPCYIFEKDGKLEGYVYVRKTGRIGPLATLSHSTFNEALTTALTLAAQQDGKAVTVLLAGSNVEAVSIAMKHKLRIIYPLLFMSTKPAADWSRYLFYSPGLM